MKFIDLHDDIEDNLGSTRAAIERILEWLDEHLDQVPGRTMTASEFGNYNTEAAGTYGDGFRAGFERAGGEVVPDPEPTNMELLEAEIKAMFQEPSQSFSIARDLAEKLDTAGWTKASGESDE